MSVFRANPGRGTSHQCRGRSPTGADAKSGLWGGYQQNDDKYSIKGTAPLDAASVASLNPTRGLKLVVYADGGSGLVIEIPQHDTGWKSNSKGTKFTFDSRKSSNVSMPLKMSIGLNSSGAKPSVQVSMKGAGHSFGDARPKVSARLTFDDGRCLEAIFAGSQGSGCSLVKGSMKCR